MKPSLAEVSSSNIPLSVGEVRTIQDINPNSPTRGKTAKTVIVGVATRDEFIKTRGKDPHPEGIYFYWVVFD